jgi:hypothetical protein
MGSKPTEPTQKTEPIPKKTFDVAIVGGGIAGLYAAWRLKEAWNGQSTGKGDAASRKALDDLKLGSGGKLEVVILEQDPMLLGGRLRSTELPFPHGSVIAEVGAMRLTTRHRLLRRLLKELKIQTVPFEGNGFSTRYFLRGKHFGSSDIEHYNKENFPYHFRTGEERKSPDDLLLLVLEHTLHELSLDDEAGPEALMVLEKLRGKHSRGSMTHREWEQIRTHGLVTGKVRLRDIGMWNLIHHYLSPEAAQFVEDGFGYESIIGNWNVSDAIPWFISDFSPGQTYETVVNGFSHLVNRLAKEFEEDIKKDDPFQCNVLLNRRVTKVSKGQKEGEAQVLCLSTEKAHPEYKHKYENRMHDFFDEQPTTEQPPTGKRTLHARLVILALPKWPLEHLDLGDIAPPGSENREKWQTRLNEVRPHRLVKIVHGYRDAWWHKADNHKGAGSRIFTDLPLRQAYYFDREWLEERGRYQHYDKNGWLIESHDKKSPTSKAWLLPILTAIMLNSGAS